jgi:hypothetical protein
MPKPLPTKRIGFQQPGEGGHGAVAAAGVSGTGEVEALNRILNNINVQTKKNELEGKLPRKPYFHKNCLFSDKEMMDTEQ